MATPNGYVPDASVGIKLCVSEALSPEAKRLFDLAGGATPLPFFVPDLFFVECANILWKHIRRSAYPADKAARDVELLRALRLTMVPTCDLISDVLPVATAYDVTAYDACYAVLAKRMGVVLVTADERLVRKLDQTPYEATWLGTPDLLPPAP